MAADLKSLRSTVEAMAAQIGQLVALGAQQIEAVARLAPVMVQSAERLSGDLHAVVRAVQTIPGPPAPTLAPPLAGENSSYMEQAEAIPSKDQPDHAVERTESIKPNRRPWQNEGGRHQLAASQVAVKSIADAKRPDRFYTTVRLPRELWDSSGFGPADRIRIDWHGKTLSISRVAEGGVKPKTISTNAVVLQSWRLGNLNFDRPKVTRGDAALRLTAR